MNKRHMAIRISALLSIALLVMLFPTSAGAESAAVRASIDEPSSVNRYVDEDAGGVFKRSGGNRLSLDRPSWAMANLALTIVTALASAWMLLGLARGGEDNHAIARLLTLIPAIAAPTAFVLAEQMQKNGPDATGRWTVLMAAITLVQMILVAIASSNNELPES